MSYHVKYKVEMSTSKEGFKKKEIPAEWGACTCLIITSIMEGKDGSKSYMLGHLGSDFKGNAVPKYNELFGAWSAMAGSIYEMDGIPDWQKKICADAFESVCKNIERLKSNE